MNRRTDEAPVLTDPRTKGRWPVVGAWLVAGAVVLGALAARLPADAFFSGDPGLKLIAAFNAIDHPSRPLEIELPRIAGEPTRYVEKFFQLHGDHAHVLQSPFFPVASAPLVALLGVRGAYVLPALGLLALVPLLEVVRRRALPDVSASLVAAAVLPASPLLFYALEFWEHTPAIALLGGATALVWATMATPAARGHARNDRRSLTDAFAPMLAGALSAAAVVLRPESLWVAAGLALVSGSLLRFFTFGIGMAAVLAPFAVANYLHTGAPAGPHAAWNLAILGDSWLAARVHRLHLWLLPEGRVALGGVAAMLASWVWAGIARARDSSRASGGRDPDAAPATDAGDARDRLRRAQTLGLFGAALVSALAASRAFTADLLWQAWPLGLLLLLPHRAPAGAKRLRILTAVALAGVLLTSTHDGGAQWGPRFVFIASPALLLLAAAAAHDLGGGDGAWRPLRLMLVAVVFACSVAANVIAYRELSGVKRFYAGIVAAAQAQIPAGSYVVTNVWWFDQVTAALHERHTVLFARGARRAKRIVRSLEAAGGPALTFVESTEETPWLMLGATTERTCYSASPPRRIPQRSVVFTAARCAEPSIRAKRQTPR